MHALRWHEGLHTGSAHCERCVGCIDGDMCNMGTESTWNPYLLKCRAGNPEARMVAETGT
jgi:hypothetical protein